MRELMSVFPKRGLKALGSLNPSRLGSHGGGLQIAKKKSYRRVTLSKK